jgi:sialic acid synthase SpsE
MTKCIEIGKRRIAPGNSAYCIAEVSADHNQDHDQAVRIIHTAKESGADAVKLQTYTADTMTVVSTRKNFASVVTLCGMGAESLGFRKVSARYVLGESKE